MTTASIRIVYRHPSERLAARLGRALLRWAETRATISRDRQYVAVANHRALEERERAAVTRLYLRG